MKHRIVAACMGLLLLGAGCTTSPDLIIEVPAEEMQETAPQMVTLHNIYLPSYDMTYDASLYEVLTGPEMTVRVADAEILQLNDGLVSLRALDTSATGLTMQFAAASGPTYENVEAQLAGSIVTKEDVQAAGYDARSYTMEDGTMHTVWLTAVGYYTLSVFDEGAQVIADSVTFL